MRKSNLLRLTIVIIVVFVFLISFSFAQADTLNDRRSFFTNINYDRLGRSTINATLRLVSDHAYLYVDDEYWNRLNSADQNTAANAFISVGQEFDNIIYPKEVVFWGPEPNPGIDDDPKLTILFEDLNSGTGGYFDSVNQFPKSSAADSNQREMIVVNASSLGSQFIKFFIAHEFQHLISYHQKDFLRNTSEDIWLNELRSEYSYSVAGYDISGDINPLLQRRIDIFKETPSDSVIDWPNVSLDYSQVLLFGRYLVEQYGPSILSETLHSFQNGVNSMNVYLVAHGYKERFDDVFGNWLVANYANNLSLGTQYGYQGAILKDIKVVPQRLTNLSGLEHYSVDYNLEQWQGYWHKFNVDSQEKKTLKIEFDEDLLGIMYLDNLGHAGRLTSPAYIPYVEGLQYFTLMPYRISPISSSQRIQFDYGNFPDQDMFQKPLTDGVLIHKKGEPDLYVIEGKYKRYLSPEVVSLYGHLDSSKAVAVDVDMFNSYTTSNYVRYINDKKVYTVWPDNTKHWLHMSAETFSSSGRDWNSIFIISDLELNYYKVGADIVR